jgi:hypothetical protein
MHTRVSRGAYNSGPLRSEAPIRGLHGPSGLPVTTPYGGRPWIRPDPAQPCAIDPRQEVAALIASVHKSREEVPPGDQHKLLASFLGMVGFGLGNTVFCKLQTRPMYNCKRRGRWEGDNHDDDDDDDDAIGIVNGCSNRCCRGAQVPTMAGLGC